jgi:hypothetical protein
VLGYGAINGLVTIVKATLPLALFSAESYACRTGILLIPGQLMAAASPFAYAWLNHRLGIIGGMWVSTGLTLIVAGLALAMVRGRARHSRANFPPFIRRRQKMGQLNICRNRKRGIHRKPHPAR